VVVFKWFTGRCSRNHFFLSASVTVCRSALRRHRAVTTAGAGSAIANSSEGVRVELFLELLTAAEVTAYGLASLQEAIDASSHASVRSALNAKCRTTRADMSEVEAALADLATDGS
jgi:hypothetical protein